MLDYYVTILLVRWRCIIIKILYDCRKWMTSVFPNRDLDLERRMMISEEKNFEATSICKVFGIELYNVYQTTLNSRSYSKFNTLFLLSSCILDPYSLHRNTRHFRVVLNIWHVHCDFLLITWNKKHCRTKHSNFHPLAYANNLEV